MTSVDLTSARRLSRYVERSLSTHPALLDDWPLQRAPQAADFAQFMAATAPPDEAAMQRALRRLRQTAMVALIARDLSGAADFAETVQTVTWLAEVAVKHAVAQASQDVAARHGWVRDAEGAPAQLMVLGMGKLGGAELNVSSDIDLIFVYGEGDGRDSDGARPLSRHDWFTRVGKRVIALIGDVTADGFVFRVDMRLRPYGDAGPLAVSLDMLEEYLVAQGRAWERFAWMKARALTGSPTDIAALEAMVRPFVFRKYLDFGAIAAIRELHQQIRREVTRRSVAQNIKLGPGGIREIEFLAQIFQVIRGGRDKRLQMRGTLPTLAQLAELQLISAPAAAELRAAYVFLRNLEHRLQYLDDQQTQTIPDHTADRELLAAGMGCADYTELAARLAAHQAVVTQHFDAVFADDREAASGALWPLTVDQERGEVELQALGYQQPAAAWELLTRFRDSARYAGLPAVSRERLDHLLPALLTRAGKTPAPGDTLRRVMGLVEAISRREAYLALLAEYPQALNQVITLYGASPWVSDYVTRHPILLDELIAPRGVASLNWPQAAQELDALLAQSEGDVEQQMDQLRHFQHAWIFRLLVADLEGVLPLETLSDHLSDLADLVLRAVLRQAWAQTPRRHCAEPAFAVIGYGKLGGKELGYGSDLDIIFLYDDAHPDAATTYARFGQRINTWLSSRTTAGDLYSTDLRLRPNGAAGLLVSSVDAFADYQRKQAWVWEHQALTRARFIGGDAHIGAAFDQVREAVLRQPREINALRLEVTNMRRKMHESHHGKPPLFDIKHDPGGLIDVEFAVQFLVLAHAQQAPELTRNCGNIALLALAAERGLLPATIAQTAADAYRALRRLQHQSRLAGKERAEIDQQQVTGERAAIQALWQAVMDA